MVFTYKKLEYKNVKFEADIVMEQRGKKARIQIDLYSIKRILGIKKRGRFMHIEQIVPEEIDLRNFVDVCKQIIKENIDFRLSATNRISARDIDNALYDVVMRQASGVLN